MHVFFALKWVFCIFANPFMKKSMIWKEIQFKDLKKNKSNLDIQKMLRFGAIMSEGKYRALEVERNQNNVIVLARLEPGFEEYIAFDLKDYDRIPNLKGSLV